MHIVMLSDIESEGGAAVAASRLATALCREGHSVTRVVKLEDGKEHEWKTIPWESHELWSYQSRILRRLYRAVGQNFDERKSTKSLDLTIATLRPDVINMHNLHVASPYGWSPELAAVCARHAPTVWTLHDMWSFTGRCAYSYDCAKFLTGCDATCPTPNEYPALAPGKIANAWNRRRALLQQNPKLAAVAPSRWMALQAEAGLWKGHRLELIPNGMPLNVYVPQDRGKARKALNIDARGPVLLMVAQLLADRRKGSALLKETLKHVSRRPLTLLTMGKDQIDFSAEGVHVHALGYLQHERSKIQAYNAADLLVHPSTADNLPNTVMESLACGTPAAAFAIGGLPEMIQPGKTGWLCEQISPQSLADTLMKAMSALETQTVEFRAACRAHAEAEWDSKMQATRYLQLFSSIASS